MSSMPNVTLQNTYQLFIGGKWRDASDGVTFTTSCRPTERLLPSARRLPGMTWT